MKRFKFQLDTNQADWAFAPVRSKPDYIRLLVHALKLMLSPTTVPDTMMRAELVLTISKMSRLMFISEKKHVSVLFPFVVTEGPTGLCFSSANHPNVDNQTTSDLLALLNTPSFSSPDAYRFIEPFVDACETDSRIWALFLDLLTCEDGYVRYDHDAKNSSGLRHPLHHIDVFYSAGVTFKVGLSSALHSAGFEDLLDLTTDCRFLRD